MNVQFLLNVIIPGIICSLLAGLIQSYIPAKRYRIVAFILVFICIFMAIENIRDLPNNLRQGIKELVYIIDGVREQQNQIYQAGNIPEEDKIERDMIANNSTPLLPSPTVLPAVELKEERHRVVEKQQQSERAQKVEMSTLLVPNDVFADRQEKTNSSLSSGRRNTNSIQTAKAVPDYYQNSSIPSIRKAFDDEPAIYAAQQQLKELGYRVDKVDGKIGPKSTKAIREFQKDNNISVSGKLDSNTLAALSNISSQVNYALQNTNSNITEKIVMDKVVKNPTVAQVSILKADKFNVNTRANFKYPSADSTPSAVNYHVVKVANDSTVQTNSSNEIPTNVADVVELSVNQLTIDNLGNNTSPSSFFVTHQGALTPSSLSPWDVPFGKSRQAPFKSGSQTEFLGGATRQLGNHTAIPPFSNFSKFGTTTGWSEVFQSSLPSVGQHSNVIRRR